MNRIDSLVSYGTNLHKTGQLETRPTSDVLRGIRNGEWREPVERVRRFPFGSTEQAEAKHKLPFVTWAGEFAHTSSKGLIRHAGQVGVDVDDLKPRECLKVISRAVFDRYCLAAFHSCSGRGVRLLFRIPAVSAIIHSKIFSQVAAHVRDFYRVEPDVSGRNVSRLSFVSFDKTMVIDLSAKTLPVEMPCTVPAPARTAPHLVVAAPPALVPAKLNFRDAGAFHLGAYFVSHRLKPDGTCYTHRRSLFQLGKWIAMRVYKHALSNEDAQRLIGEVFAGWIAGVRRGRLTLKREEGEYRRELSRIVQSSLKRPGIAAAAAKWTRWLADSEFPTNGDPEDRLLYAIRKHCEVERTKVFYISCRDAAVVAGVKSTRTSAKLLRDLCRRNILTRADEKNYSFYRCRRHAQKYRLVG